MIRIKKLLLPLTGLMSSVMILTSLGGCSSDSVDVGVYLADDIQDSYGYCPSLEVDIMGLSDVEEKRLLTYDVDKYFTPPAQFRSSLDKVTLRFSESDMTAKILPDDADIWDRWEKKGANYVGIIANLPLLTDLKDGAVDPRKIIINMHDGTLKDSSAHYILISGSGLVELKKKPKSKNVVELEDKPQQNTNAEEQSEEKKDGQL